MTSVVWAFMHSISLFSVSLQKERSDLFLTGHDFRQIYSAVFCFFAECLFCGLFCAGGEPVSYTHLTLPTNREV